MYVQVIGRFIQNEEVGLAYDGFCQRHFCFFPPLNTLIFFSTSSPQIESTPGDFSIPVPSSGFLLISFHPNGIIQVQASN
jgi:hypothetical protein